MKYENLMVNCYTCSGVREREKAVAIYVPWLREAGIDKVILDFERMGRNKENEVVIDIRRKI